MKRHSNLWPQIIAPANIHTAFAKAARGKRDRAEVVAFSQQLDANCLSIARDLAAGVFRFGHYRRFTIYEPKERFIHAASFGERVAHHALMNLCGPILEKKHVYETFACRVGKGRTQALYHARRCAAACPFFLKMDVRKYFDSIPHWGIRELLSRAFKEEPLLACFNQILRAYQASEGRGLPIGSLTSQHFANAYLGRIDRLVKEKLGLPHYARYMDVMAVWHEDKKTLQDARKEIQAELKELGLGFKPDPFLNRSAVGMDFLGCRVFPRKITPNHATRVRTRRKLARLEAGHYPEAYAQAVATALVANTQVGCHWARTASIAAARGTTMRTTAGWRTATGTPPRTGTTTSGSAWPEHNLSYAVEEGFPLHLLARGCPGIRPALPLTAEGKPTSPAGASSPAAAGANAPAR